MQTVNLAPVNKERAGRQMALVCVASGDSFTFRAGDWLMTLMRQPRWGEIVLVHAEGRGEFLARYEGATLVLPSGERTATRRSRLLGVVKRLDRFVCDSFPIEIRVDSVEGIRGLKTYLN